MAKKPKTKSSRSALCSRIWNSLDMLQDATTCSAAEHFTIDEMCYIANKLNALVVETGEFFYRIAAQHPAEYRAAIKKKTPPKKKGRTRG